MDAGAKAQHIAGGRPGDGQFQIAALGQPPFHRPDRAGQYQQQDKSGAQHDQAALG
jgi:hypothetical protein